MVQWSYVEPADEDEDAMWEARYQHAVVSFKGAIWVIGGGTVRGTLKNDLWRSASLSADRWELVGDQNVCLADAVEGEIGCMPPRRGHAAAVDPGGDKVLVFGGLSKKGDVDIFLNDVWETSGDCETLLRCFKLVRETNAWPGRYLHAGLVYQQSLWVIGGQYCGDAVDTCRGSTCKGDAPSDQVHQRTPWLDLACARHLSAPAYSRRCWLLCIPAAAACRLLSVCCLGFDLTPSSLTCLERLCRSASAGAKRPTARQAFGRRKESAASWKEAATGRRSWAT